MFTLVYVQIFSFLIAHNFDKPRILEDQLVLYILLFHKRIPRPFVAQLQVRAA